MESNSLEELTEELDIKAEQFLETVKELDEAVADERLIVQYRLDGRRTKGLKPNKTK